MSPEPTDPRDAPGRSRLFPNVLAGWVAHAVTLVIGFVMPRLVNESLGQTTLGLWDLGWSMVVYLGYSGLGTGSAVAHFVSRYRAQGEPAALVGEATATAWYCQLLLALVLGGSFMLFFFGITDFMSGLAAWEARAIVWMGVLLGFTVCVALMGDIAQGILAGCHHQSSGEYVSIGSDVALAIAMTAVLLLGGGIIMLAAVTLCVRGVFETLRVALGARTCPELSFAPRDFRMPLARTVARYGIKSSTSASQELLVGQVARVTLALTAGPVALACYSRYSTLIRQIARAVDRSTVVVPSMTSGLVGVGREADVVRLNLRASNAAMLALLPMVVLFGVFGDDIVAIWMGPEFVVPGLAVVLAVMALLSGDRMVANRVLSGLNSHGRIGLVCLITSMTILIAGLLLVRPLDPLRAGILVTISTVVGYSLPHFVMTCRRLQIPVSTHFREVYFKPMISNLLFLAILLGADRLLHDGARALAIGTAATAFAGLALSYWVFAFDARLRGRVRRRVLRLAR
jgi:O-antigen/teichoic acid export membrane protein